MPDSIGGKPHQHPPDFSLAVGGPFFRLLRRAHLYDDAMLLVRQRVIVFSLFAWLPLLLLSMLQGQLLGGEVAAPFLLDVEVHVRFLVAMPLLIGSELLVHQRMRYVVRQFLERNLVPDNAMPRFDGAIASASRLRNSTLAEALLIALVYGVGVLIVWRHYVALDAATWYAIPSAGSAKLSLAGMWYGYVSLPMFQFLLVRWYYRLFIWARLLWQVSRIQLDLVPTHPDRFGGLGFLSTTVNALILIGIAHGALVAGNIADQILYLEKTLPEFAGEIAIMVVFVQCVVVAPLLVFVPQLVATRWKGLLEYGTLSMRYVREFDTKWFRGGWPADEALVGSSDIQSLADLDTSYQIVQTMHLVPVAWKASLLLGLATLTPIAPLLLTMMPIEELLEKLFSMLF
jgi:hypothetical protein